MSVQPELVIALIRGMALLALVTLARGFVVRTMSAYVTKGLAVGTIFGAGAVFTMTDPFVLDPGVIVDARSIILVLAGPFGGLAGATVAGTMAVAYRIWLGGAGAPIGVLIIATSVVTGVVLKILLAKRKGGYDLRELMFLGSVGSSLSLLLLLLPYFAPGVQPLNFIVPHMITNFLGIVLLGHFLSAEGRRRHAHRSAQMEASTDPLTGLPNRRVFERAAAEAYRSPGGVALLLVDIDNFKQVNDRWGHDVGDRILKEVADAIRAQVRDDDLVARYGGEEIAVILPKAPQEDALAVAERIRRAVDEDVFYGNRLLGNVTVSVGVAISGTSGDFAKLFSLADGALYRAKALGRNRVEMAPALVMSDVEGYAASAVINERNFATIASGG